MTMSMMVTMRPEQGWLDVEATGQLSLPQAKRTFLEMLGTVERYGVGKVLLDGRGLTGKPKVMDRFYYGEFAANAVLKQATRAGIPAPQFAYVLREPGLDPQRFGQTVAINRGMRVKVFDNLGDARVWLGIEPPGTTDTDAS